MVMFSVNVNGNNWYIECSSRSNRSGFVHEAKLYREHDLISEVKCQYYNRTWERYRFESAIGAVLYQYNEELIDKAKESAKKACGVTTMRAKATRDTADFILNSAKERAMADNFKTDESDWFSLRDVEGLKAIELLRQKKDEYNGW